MFISVYLALKSAENKMQYEHLIKVPLNIIEFRPDVLEVIRKTYNLDQPGRLDEAIDILEAWVRKQDHFTRKEFGKYFIFCFNICSLQT